MSTASSGRRREYQVRDHLIEHGFAFIMRAAASKGSGDLLMGHPFTGALLVQVGTESKQLGPDARNRFVGDADLIGATPVLATVIAQPGKRTEIEFWVVTRDVPSTWRRWDV